MICSKCQTENSASARFCRNCGTSLQLACSNCGTTMSVGDRFCTACGQPASITSTTDDVRLNRLNQAAPASLIDKIRTAEVSGDRKVVTALFADVVGSTSLAEQMDAEEWTAIMNPAFDLLSPPIYRYEGTIARLLGDALLAFFGAPIAHEDDPVRAVFAALDLIAAARLYAEKMRKDHDIEFAIRVGVNTGPVVVGNVGSDLKYEYTAMGDAVNLAARMQSAARPMTVLISQYTYKFIAPFFEVSDLGFIEVKGKAEPVHVYEVLGPKAAPERARGLTGLESPMVGRDAELASLQRLSTLVQAGTGRAAVILGEPGLGKSRLISEWKTHVLRGNMRWVEGQCLSYGKDLAYHLALSLLRSLIGVSAVSSETETEAALRKVVFDLFGDAGKETYAYLAQFLSLQLDGASAERVGTLDPQSLQMQYVDAFRVLLRAVSAQTPLVLVLEDTHWADPSSVDLLIKLLPLAFQSRLLFCFVARAERDVPGWKLIAATHEIIGENVLDIRLSPLSEADSQQLVSNLLEIQALPVAVKTLIYRKAEGNPFFVEEVIRMLIDRGIIVPDGDRWVATKAIEKVDIPDNLLGLLLARIDRQPDDVKHTMRIAAVIGRQFPVKVLQQVMGREEAEALASRLSVLESANLIKLAQIEPDLEYLFRHALIQDAAYESLLKRDRQRLHLAVGRILEILYADRLDELAAVIAYHFYEGGSLPDAQRYFVMAGDQAVRQYANVEAAIHYTRAIEITPADDIALIRLYRARAQTYDASGDFDHARQDYESALALAQKSMNRRAEWQATLDLGMLWAGRDYAQAGSYFQQAYTLAETLGDPAALAYSLNRIGNWHVNHEEPQQGNEYHQRALGIFEEANDRQGIAETVDLLAMGAWLGGASLKANSYYQRAVPLFRELGQPYGLSSSLTGLGGIAGLGFFALTTEGNVAFEDVIRSSEEAVEIARRIGWRSGEAFSLNMMGIALSLTGNYNRSLDCCSRAMQIADEIQHHQWMALTKFFQGTLYEELGRAKGAQELIESALVLARQINSLYWTRMTSAMLAYAHILQSNWQEAEQLLDTILTPTTPASTFSERTAWGIRVELLLATGKLDEAMQCLDLLVRDAQELDSTGENVIPSIALLRGKVLTEMIRTGKDVSPDMLQRAESALLAAKRLAEPWPKLPRLWRATASLARFYQVTGRADDTQRELAATHTAIEAILKMTPTEFHNDFLQSTEDYMRF